MEEKDAEALAKAKEWQKDKAGFESLREKLGE